MKAILKWSEGMQFAATADGQIVNMDAKSPIGKGSAMTPKELIAAGLGGCTAMDVVALLKKHQQPLNALEVEVDIETSKGTPPMVFTKADIYFKLSGSVDRELALESVRLSQTKYCGVSAMLVKAFPIGYHVLLNGEKIGSGAAKFE